MFGTLQLQARLKSIGYSQFLGALEMDMLTIGEMAARSGVANSAVRYYESLGLIASQRTDGNQRRYPKHALRRVSVIRAAQQLGLSLEEIRAALATLPVDHNPTPEDWERMAAAWQANLDARIASLIRLRDDLSSCIGCGCLSLERCSLFNRGDRAAAAGPGPRYLMGDVAVVDGATSD
jgi:MerR family redox-sensitive transcriptional activator SoxR